MRAVTITDTGVIEAESGTLSLQGGGTMAGTIEAAEGGSLTTTGRRPTSPAARLTGATWIVGANSTMSLAANITTDAATIVLDGGC